MKPGIAIPLGVAGILAAIGPPIPITNANGLFGGHPFLAYCFWGASFALIIVAIVGWVVNSKREKKNDLRLPTPSVQGNQENKQEFNPQQNCYFNSSLSGTVLVEPDEIAISVR